MRLVTAVCVLVAMAGCKPNSARRTDRTQQPLTKPELPRGEGIVVVAAAGDISPDKLDLQQATGEQLAAGGFDAVLLMGDSQYPNGALADYQRYFEPTWGRFKDRIWPSPGNHEYGTPNAAGYFSYFGARAGDPDKGWYSFNLGSWHLVSLNTNNACKVLPCGKDSEQAKWLEADLAANKSKCALAYWHHPRFSSGPHGGFEGAAPLWNVLEAHGVDLVLNGHDHIYERFVPLSAAGTPAENGIVQFTVGTGGAELYTLKPTPAPNSVVANAEAHGVLALALMPEGYAWDFLSLPPSKFKDRGEGKCH